MQSRLLILTLWFCASQPENQAIDKLVWWSSSKNTYPVYDGFGIISNKETLLKKYF